MFKWLKWDGRHHLHGTCNQRDQLRISRRQHLEMAPVILAPKQEAQRLCIPNTVDVALHKLVEHEDGVCMKIQLHNPFFISGLMLRIYRGTVCEPHTLVYQELLDREEINQLLDAPETGIAGMPLPCSAPLVADDTDPWICEEPYTARIWVGNQPHSFQPWMNHFFHESQEPQEIPGQMVSHEYKPGSPYGVPGRNGLKHKPLDHSQTQCPHRIFIAAAGDPESTRQTIRYAAKIRAPFTEALLRFSKPITQPQSSSSSN